MVLLGLVDSPWVILTIPAAMLIGFAFAAVGMAATTCVRRWTDFDWSSWSTLPMFLFSATFYPINVYPPSRFRLIVALTPLYQGVGAPPLALARARRAGAAHPVVYLSVMGLVGLAIVDRRLARLLLK